jgi:hypothetical protein
MEQVIIKMSTKEFFLFKERASEASQRFSYNRIKDEYIVRTNRKYAIDEGWDYIADHSPNGSRPIPRLLKSNDIDHI